MIRVAVFNVNQRICPTLFIITLPQPKTATPSATVFEMTKNLHNFIMDASACDEIINGYLNDTFLLSLVCELCRQPQEPPYEIHQTREAVVGKFLPLAKVGLKAACAVNVASSLGKVFGYETPEIPAEYLSSANEFLNLVNKSTLDDFKTLQEQVRLGHEQEAGAGGATALGNATSVEPERNMGEEGYCIREFRRFLKTIDAKDEWCGLSAKISDDGDVFFACKECCK